MSRHVPMRPFVAKNLPRNAQGRLFEHEPRPPASWAARPTWGQYPKGFVEWACRTLAIDSTEVWHVCSGALWGPRTVDIDPAVRPAVVANGLALPFADGALPHVFLDPPYSEDYARDLYGGKYPRPSHLLREAARVVACGGVVALLHIVTPNEPAACRHVGTWGITTGPGFRIRAWSVYRRLPRLL